MRGFEPGKVGPNRNEIYLGGNYISAVNFSTTLPNFLPELQSLSFTTFIDAANLWGVDYDDAANKSNNTIRSSVGLAIDFTTPIGPLNFVFAQPITKASTDKTEFFRF